MQRSYPFGSFFNKHFSQWTCICSFINNHSSQWKKTTSIHSFFNHHHSVAQTEVLKLTSFVYKKDSKFLSLPKDEWDNIIDKYLQKQTSKRLQITWGWNLTAYSFKAKTNGQRSFSNQLKLSGIEIQTHQKLKYEHFLFGQDETVCKLLA